MPGVAQDGFVRSMIREVHMFRLGNLTPTKSHSPEPHSPNPSTAPWKPLVVAVCSSVVYLLPECNL